MLAIVYVVPYKEEEDKEEDDNEEGARYVDCQRQEMRNFPSTRKREAIIHKIVPNWERTTAMQSPVLAIHCFETLVDIVSSMAFPGALCRCCQRRYGTHRMLPTRRSREGHSRWSRSSRASAFPSLLELVSSECSLQSQQSSPSCGGETTNEGKMGATYSFNGWAFQIS